MTRRTTATATAAALTILAILAPAGTPAQAAPGPQEIPRICFEETSSTAGVVRIGGADRFVVSAGASADAFADTGGTVFLASGANFPDALAGSAAAGYEDGPVLLTTRDALSPAVQAELERLKPEKIVVLGGTNSISTELEFSLERFAPVVARYGGPDRYAVAAETATSTFVAAGIIYVASGEGFADALSASAAAGYEGGPVLLVQKNAVPQVTRDAIGSLNRLGLLQRIVVLGGPNSVSDTVVAELSDIVSTKRIAGADRFAVSAAVSKNSFCSDAATVYIASGAVFPDALSGAAAAIEQYGPVLLVTSDSIPPAVATELERLNPERIVVLGGPNTVSDKVVADLGRFLRP